MRSQWWNYINGPYNKTREKRRRLRQRHRADGFKCGKCGARSVRLYRDYGTFLRTSELRCNACLTSTEWMVPCVSASDGTVWGYTSCPESDIARWYARPDADKGTAAPRWNRRDGQAEGWRVERQEAA